MSKTRLTWKGPNVQQQIAAKAAEGLHQFDLRLETASKQELYPGHGKLTGALQRSIQAFPVTQRGSILRGGIGTRGIPYAMVIHRRYHYMIGPFNRLKGSAGDIITGAMRG